MPCNRPFSRHTSSHLISGFPLPPAARSWRGPFKGGGLGGRLRLINFQVEVIKKTHKRREGEEKKKKKGGAKLWDPARWALASGTRRRDGE